MLAKILFDDRISRQFDPREPEETDMIVSSLLPVTRSIPTEQLYPCYVLAIEMRSQGNNFPVSGGELVQAWKERQSTLEMESINGTRLLSERAPGACLRCGQDGREIHLDGTVGGPCDHRPLTEEEKAEASRIKLEQIELAKAERRKTEEAGKAAAQKVEAKPVGIKLECTDCLRRVDSLMGWKIGDMCGNQLNDLTESKPILCGGKMRMR